LIVKFPDNFNELITDYQTSTDTLPNVDIYYNPSENYSRDAYYNILGALEYHATEIGIERFGDSYNPFTVNIGFDDNQNQIFDEEKASGQMFAGMLPMLIIMFLFSAAMSIGPDSIAGEKERGTIATLLVTPTKRSEIAIGKVLSLSVISLFSATSSFIGIIFSLPKLLQSNELSIAIYGPAEFAMLFSVLLATVLVIVGVISCISAYAKTIKEASLLIMPFYFVSIVVGISTLMSGEANQNPIMYLVPIYNSVHIIISILTFETTATTFFIMIGSSVVYVSILIFVLNKFFQSEKIMFAK
jgi:sodium transport system permease protein